MVCSNFSSWLADWTFCSFTTAFISFLYLSLTAWNQCKESNSRYWSSSFRMYATPERAQDRWVEINRQCQTYGLGDASSVKMIYHCCPLTHCKAIIRESSSTFIFLVEFLFAADGVLHKVNSLWHRSIAYNSLQVPLQSNKPGIKMKSVGTDQWRYDHVEVPQMHVLGTAKFRGKHRHQHLEVLRPLGRVAGQISQHWV